MQSTLSRWFQYAVYISHTKEHDLMNQILEKFAYKHMYILCTQIVKQRTIINNHFQREKHTTSLFYIYKN